MGLFDRERIDAFDVSILNELGIPDRLSYSMSETGENILKYFGHVARRSNRESIEKLAVLSKIEGKGHLGHVAQIMEITGYLLQTNLKMEEDRQHWRPLSNQ